MAGATTIEINGVPVTTTAPFPVTLVAGGGGQSNVNITQVSGVANPAAITAQAYTVARVATDSVLRADDGTTYSVPSTRAMGTDASIAKALLGLTVNARIGAYNRLGTADFRQLDCIVPSSAEGLGDANLFALATVGVIAGHDTAGAVTHLIECKGALTAQAYTLQRLLGDTVIRGDDGATYSAVATRTFTGLQGASAGLQALVAGAQIAGSDPINANQFLPIGSTREISASAAQGILSVAESRARGYNASLRGRRYVCKSPNLTGVAAATSFVATTPTFLIVCGATKSIVVKRIKANLPLVGTSTTFRMLVKTDTANRFSAGGTARAPQTMNGGNIVATGLAQNLEAPTATAEGGGTKDIDCDSNQLVAGSECVFEAEDGLIIPANGSLLVYVVTATAGATIDYTIEFEEAQVQ